MSSDLRNVVSHEKTVNEKMSSNDIKTGGSNQGEKEAISPPESGSKQWKDLYRALAEYAKNLKQ